MRGEEPRDGPRRVEDARAVRLVVDRDADLGLERGREGEELVRLGFGKVVLARVRVDRRERRAEAERLAHLPLPDLAVRVDVARRRHGRVGRVGNASCRHEAEVARRRRRARGENLRDAAEARGVERGAKLGHAVLHHERDRDLQAGVAERLELREERGDRCERVRPARVGEEAPRGRVELEARRRHGLCYPMQSVPYREIGVLCHKSCALGVPPLP